MIGGLVVVEYLAVAALAGYGFYLTVAGKLPGRPLKIAVNVVAALLAVQAVLATVRLFGGHLIPESSTFLIYLVVSVCLLPVAHQWATAERTRWSGAVVAVAAIGIGVALWRLQGLWAAGNV